MTSLGLEWNPYVTQIEPHDYIAGAPGYWETAAMWDTGGGVFGCSLFCCGGGKHPCWQAELHSHQASHATDRTVALSTHPRVLARAV